MLGECDGFPLIGPVITFLVDGLFEGAVHGVVLQQVQQGCWVGKIVDGDNINIIILCFDPGAKDCASDASKSVDGNA